jgi:hypothetical protein
MSRRGLFLVNALRSDSVRNFTSDFVTNVRVITAGFFQCVVRGCECGVAHGDPQIVETGRRLNVGASGFSNTYEVFHDRFSFVKQPGERSP